MFTSITSESALDICTRTAYSIPYVGHVDRDDLIGEAALKLCKHADRINTAPDPEGLARRMARLAMYTFLRRESPEWRKNYWGTPNAPDYPSPFSVEDHVVRTLDAQALFAQATPTMRRAAEKRAAGEPLTPTERKAVRRAA